MLRFVVADLTDWPEVTASSGFENNFYIRFVCCLFYNLRAAVPRAFKTKFQNVSATKFVN